MDKETIYSKGDNFVETEVDEEIILMNLEDGHFFSLVSTSRRIWKLLDNIQTLHNLCGTLSAEFDVPLNQCQVDTAKLLEQLIDQKFLNVQTTISP